MAANYLYSPDFVKRIGERERVKHIKEAMRVGYHPIASFARTVQWGPFRYSYPKKAGSDWPYFLTQIVVYAKNP
jgi:hypothetical protein